MVNFGIEKVSMSVTITMKTTRIHTTSL